MDVTAPVTDYVRGSLLTTKGDILKRGAAINARLGIGSAGQIVRVNAVPDDLEYQHPGQFLFDNELSAENAGQVTVAGGWIDIVTLDLGTVVNGDRFLVGAGYDAPKTTAGTMLRRISKDSGTSTIEFLHSRNALNDAQYGQNAVGTMCNLSGVLKVTGSGTLVIHFAGMCSAGSVVIPAANGQIYATQLKNA